MHHKTGVIKTLVDKAIKLAHPNFHKNNLKKVKEILLLNNYPKKFIDFHVNKRVNYITSTENNSISNNINNSVVNRNIFKLPYNGNLSENIYNFVKKYNMDIIYHIPCKLNKFIRLGKDRLTKQKQKNVVYCIECKNCDKKYYGQTSRLAKTREGEHKDKYVQKQNNYNVLSSHKQ